MSAATTVLDIASVATLVAALIIYTVLYNWWRSRAGTAVILLLLSMVLYRLPDTIGRLTSWTRQSLSFQVVRLCALGLGVIAASWCVYALIYNLSREHRATLPDRPKADELEQKRKRRQATDRKQDDLDPPALLAGRPQLELPLLCNTRCQGAAETLRMPQLL